MTDRAQILLVDDEANIRRMLAALLREEGFTVAEAANGNAALRSMMWTRRRPRPPHAARPDGLATLSSATGARSPSS